MPHNATYDEGSMTGKTVDAVIIDAFGYIEVAVQAMNSISNKILICNITIEERISGESLQVSSY